MAKKPKLSNNQKRRIAANRKKQLQRNTSEDANADLLGFSDLQQGRVVSRYGKHAIVECFEVLEGRDTRHRYEHKCYIRRTIKSVVCGDNVLFRTSLSDDIRARGIIEVVQDRKSTLSRPDFYDGIKPVAANIDQIVIVSSIVPVFSQHIIDRYLVACENAAICPLIVVNKIELLSPLEISTLNLALDIYRNIGYQVKLISCVSQQGLQPLIDSLKDKVSVFVGQSGVGKSSIINQLIPSSNEEIGDVSDNSGLGQHTTTAAKLIPFTHGGELIDSPGVREFGLWHLPVDEITNGFIEFKNYLGGCKFSDCTHRGDPGCLIRANVELGNIHEERYNSYLKIIDSLEQNRPAYIKE